MKRKMMCFFIAFFVVLSPLVINAEPYQRKSDYIFYVDEPTEVYKNANDSETMDTIISPGVYEASDRNNNYYKFEYKGRTYWALKNSHMEVKEVLDMDDAEVEVIKERKVYSQPFDDERYETDETLEPGVYKVSKKAFDWLYIKRVGWINSEYGNAKFVDTIDTYKNPGFTTIRYKNQIIALNPYRRPGITMIPKGIIIHNTANTSKTANAQSHADLLDNPNSTRQTSWHFTVDDHQVIQSLPLNEVGYHAGDGLSMGNGDMIGIEICENEGGNFEQAVLNTARLVAYLLEDLDLTIDDVYTHQDFSGKYCPRKMFDNKMWDGFIEQIQKFLDGEELPQLPNNGTNPDKNEENDEKPQEEKPQEQEPQDKPEEENSNEEQPQDENPLPPTTGWFDLGNGDWLFYEEDYSLKTRWLAGNKGVNDWYWLNDGKMLRNGWIPTNTGWYYVGDDGAMVADVTIQTSDGLTATFDASGVWVK